jgi:hypothetical protein
MNVIKSFFFSSKKFPRTIISPLFDVPNNKARYASTYRAAILKEHGEPLIIGELKRQSIKKGQMRIRVYCCGINSVDWHNVAGDIEPKPKLPFVPGFEVILL